jgi:hypothetical protein
VKQKIKNLTRFENNCLDDEKNYAKAKRLFKIALCQVFIPFIISRFQSSSLFFIVHISRYNLII